MALFLFSAALFVSALLLFSVQPLIAKVPAALLGRDSSCLEHLYDIPKVLIFAAKPNNAQIKDNGRSLRRGLRY